MNDIGSLETWHLIPKKTASSLFSTDFFLYNLSFYFIELYNYICIFLMVAYILFTKGRRNFFISMPNRIKY